MFNYVPSYLNNPYYIHVFIWDNNILSVNNSNVHCDIYVFKIMLHVYKKRYECALSHYIIVSLEVFFKYLKDGYHYKLSDISNWKKNN